MLMPQLELGKLDALILVDAVYLSTDRFNRATASLIGAAGTNDRVGVGHESVATGFLPARQSPANRCGKHACATLKASIPQSLRPSDPQTLRS
jgi:hypothetical protein